MRAPSTMEDNSTSVIESVNFGLLSTSNFEKELKEMLGWNKQEWFGKGKKYARLQRLCNSMKYWSKKLKPAMIETSMVVTLFNVEKDIKMELEPLIWEIEKLDPNIKVRGYSDFRNPRYLCLYFNSKEECESIKEKFRLCQNNYVVLLSWALEESVTLLNVHWLPMAIDLDLIKEEVSKYAKIILEERKNYDMLSGRLIPSGKIAFKVKMKEGVSVDAVPHLATIAKMEALITIQGRMPLCLNCNSLGHISKKCLRRFCSRCKSLQLKEHECKLNSEISYADVARGPPSLGDPDQSWGSESEEIEENINVDIASMDVGEQLQKRIKMLENQLSDHENLASLALKPEKKKKKRKRKIKGGEDSTSAQEIEDSFDKLNEIALSGASHDAAVGVSSFTLPLIKDNILSFEGLSSLNQSPQFKKSYGRVSKLSEKQIKAQLKYDALSSDRESIFTD